MKREATTVDAELEPEPKRAKIESVVLDGVIPTDPLPLLQFLPEIFAHIQSYMDVPTRVSMSGTCTTQYKDTRIWQNEQADLYKDKHYSVHVLGQGLFPSNIEELEEEMTKTIQICDIEKADLYLLPFSPKDRRSEDISYWVGRVTYGLFYTYSFKADLPPCGESSNWMANYYKRFWEIMVVQCLHLGYIKLAKHMLVKVCNAADFGTSSITTACVAKIYRKAIYACLCLHLHEPLRQILDQASELSFAMTDDGILPDGSMSEQVKSAREKDTKPILLNKIEHLVANYLGCGPGNDGIYKGRDLYPRSRAFACGYVIHGGWKEPTIPEIHESRPKGPMVMWVPQLRSERVVTMGTEDEKKDLGVRRYHSMVRMLSIMLGYVDDNLRNLVFTLVNGMVTQKHISKLSDKDVRKFALNEKMFISVYKVEECKLDPSSEDVGESAFVRKCTPVSRVFDPKHIRPGLEGTLRNFEEDWGKDR